MTVQLLTGDCREVLATLPERSIQCCVTSPPYHGLRDYQTARWEGGDPDCDHRSDTMRAGRNENRAMLAGSPATNSAQLTRYANVPCGKCGAVRIDKGIGLELTIDEHIAALVDVFRGVWRVLRDDGTVWLNYGDAYFGTGKGPTPPTGFHAKNGGTFYPTKGIYSHEVLKGKDLIGLPWRIAFALQADGWYLRSAIVWHKPNPMPESVTDRPTSAYEHIFLLTKSGKYFYDAEAIAEPASSPPTKMPDGWDTGPGAHGTIHRNGREKGKPVNKQAELGKRTYTGFNERWDAREEAPPTRNARNVWTIPTAGFAEAHFAVFPPEIPRRCILAGTSDKGECPACGAPWVRKVEASTPSLYATQEYRVDGAGRRTGASPDGSYRGIGYSRSETIGWQPSCTCDAGDPVPQTVLDPFAGAGTTLLVADRLGRNAVGVEVNESYVQMAKKRITNDAPLFVDLETA